MALILALDVLYVRMLSTSILIPQAPLRLK
jgi:hypothetical protein